MRSFLMGLLAATAVVILTSACAAAFEESGTEWSGTVDGTEWTVVATYEGTDGLVCLNRRAGNMGSDSCVQPVLDTQVLRVEGVSDDDSLPVQLIAGQVAPSVTDVRVRLGDGDVRALELRDLSGTDRRVFAVAFAQDDEPQVVEAETDDGRVRSFGL